MLAHKLPFRPGARCRRIVPIFAEGKTYRGPSWAQPLLGKGFANNSEEPDRNTNR
jgi:hypothetical protein